MSESNTTLPGSGKSKRQQADQQRAAETRKASAEATAQDVDAMTGGEAASLAFGAIVARLRQAAATGEPADISGEDLAGLETRLPRSWVAPFAVLRAMIDANEVPTDKLLVKRLHSPSVAGLVRDAISDAQGLSAAAPAVLERLHNLPPARRGLSIGGHRGGRRIRVRHNGYIAPGWRERAPRPVTVHNITLAPRTALELTVTSTEYLRWRTSRSVDVEVLEGEPGLVPTTV